MNEPLLELSIWDDLVHIILFSLLHHAIKEAGEIFNLCNVVAFRKPVNKRKKLLLDPAPLSQEQIHSGPGVNQDTVRALLDRPAQNKPRKTL